MHAYRDSAHAARSRPAADSRDAWVFGAADPNSGTAALLEVAKGLGALVSTGAWRPKRTLVLCSWSGEEYGLLGSTAWAEVNQHVFPLARALAYLNVDVAVSGRHLKASGTPSFRGLVGDVLAQVAHPESGRPLVEAWEAEAAARTPPADALGPLGSGSDYTVRPQLEPRCPPAARAVAGHSPLATHQP